MKCLDLQNDIDQVTREAASLKRTVDDYEKRAAVREGAINKAEGEMGELQSTIEKQRSDIKELKEQHSAEIEARKRKYQTLQTDLSDEQKQLSKAKRDKDELALKLKTIESSMGVKEQNQMQLKSKIDEMSANLENQETKIRDLKNKLETLDSRCKVLNEQVCVLKGTIRVMIRVRPLLSEEEKASGNEHLKYSYDAEGRDQIEIVNPKAITTKVSTDKIIKDDMSQETVFSEIKSMVQSALDGHNVCMFAYGQTGSGKTFSMEGPDEASDETEGLIPRTG